jgi:hypothetical protein
MASATHRCAAEHRLRVTELSSRLHLPQRVALSLHAIPRLESKCCQRRCCTYSLLVFKASCHVNCFCRIIVFATIVMQALRLWDWRTKSRYSSIVFHMLCYVTQIERIPCHTRKLHGCPAVKPAVEVCAGRNFRITPDPARTRSLSSNMLLVSHLSPTSFYSSPIEVPSIYNMPWLSHH